MHEDHLLQPHKEPHTAHPSADQTSPSDLLKTTQSQVEQVMVEILFEIRFLINHIDFNNELKKLKTEKA